MSTPNLIGGILEGIGQGRLKIQQDQIAQDQASTEGFRNMLNTLIKSGNLPADRMDQATNMLLGSYTDPKFKVEKAHQQVLDLMKPVTLPPSAGVPSAPGPSLALPTPPGATGFPQAPPAGGGPIGPPPAQLPGPTATPPVPALATPPTPPFAGPTVGVTDAAREEQLQLAERMASMKAENKPDNWKLNTNTGDLYNSVTGEVRKGTMDPKTAAAKMVDALIELPDGSFKVDSVGDPSTYKGPGQIRKVGAGVTASWTPLIQNGVPYGVKDPTGKDYLVGDKIPAQGKSVMDQVKSAHAQGLSEQEQKAADAASRAEANRIADEERKSQSAPPTVLSQITKDYSNVQAAEQRMETMTKALKKANAGDAQADMALIANHIGMTLGAQKGARITQTVWNEAMAARPWLQGAKVKFEGGLMTGALLSPQQREQMVGLAKDMVATLHDNYRTTLNTYKPLYPRTKFPEPTWVSQPEPPDLGGGGATGGGGLPPGWKSPTK